MAEGQKLKQKNTKLLEVQAQGPSLCFILLPKPSHMTESKVMTKFCHRCKEGWGTWANHAVYSSGHYVSCGGQTQGRCANIEYIHEMFTSKQNCQIQVLKEISVLCKMQKILVMQSSARHNSGLWLLCCTEKSITYNRKETWASSSPSTLLHRLEIQGPGKGRSLPKFTRLRPSPQSSVLSAPLNCQGSDGLAIPLGPSVNVNQM